LPRFYIAKYPITHAQADSFFNSEVGAKLFRTGQPVGATLPQMPEDLTWKVANTMAHWFGGRLPTIYEWEKAARGTDGRLYPWGNEWQPWSGNFGNQYLAESSRRLGTGVTVVDAYPSGVSPYGVWDMVGNLEEWTCSEYPFYPTLGDLDYVTKGAGRKNLESPPWLWTITAFDQRGYKDKWHVCVRPVKDTLE
ncbi:MAG TPA: SUMF1/EgtB/PvdO family nonheme iron enzyme, partial [Phototrophicaceae bacterium]|nr:SUMF1/EgtB/PvdO family nonheme iron enzyme [Phototrophicaceae bacterium]